MPLPKSAWLHSMWLLSWDGLVALDFTLHEAPWSFMEVTFYFVKQKARNYRPKLRMVACTYSPRNLGPEGCCGFDTSMVHSVRCSLRQNKKPASWTKDKKKKVLAEKGLWNEKQTKHVWIRECFDWVDKIWLVLLFAVDVYGVLRLRGRITLPHSWRIDCTEMCVKCRLSTRKAHGWPQARDLRRTEH
jgi:hypothetical protein